MAKVKEKIVTNPGAKKRQVNLNVKRSEGQSEHELEAEQIAQFWEEEVSELSNQTFATEQDAVNAVIGRVVTRLKTPQKLVAETTKFLELMFATDPTLTEELRELVQIDPSHKTK